MFIHVQCSQQIEKQLKTFKGCALSILHLKLQPPEVEMWVSSLFVCSKSNAALKIVNNGLRFNTLIW